jgi:large subunit ribosomal protein L6
MSEKATKSVEIPDGIEVRQDGHSLVVKGPSGELSRDFRHPKITTKVRGSEVSFTAADKRKKSRAMLGTYAAHLRNMITGVTRGWESRLKVVYSHFPAKLGVEGDKVLIQNFMGERSPRKAQIAGQTKVEIKKEEIVVSGIDKEATGQTAANIELATKVTGYDRRIFQDGCYITQKCSPMVEGKAEGEA